MVLIRWLRNNQLFSLLTCSDLSAITTGCPLILHKNLLSIYTLDKILWKYPLNWTQIEKNYQLQAELLMNQNSTHIKWSVPLRKPWINVNVFLFIKELSKRKRILTCHKSKNICQSSFTFQIKPVSGLGTI